MSYYIIKEIDKNGKREFYFDTDGSVLFNDLSEKIKFYYKKELRPFYFILKLLCEAENHELENKDLEEGFIQARLKYQNPNLSSDEFDELIKNTRKIKASTIIGKINETLKKNGGTFIEYRKEKYRLVNVEKVDEQTFINYKNGEKKKISKLKNLVTLYDSHLNYVNTYVTRDDIDKAINGNAICGLVGVDGNGKTAYALKSGYDKQNKYKYQYLIDCTSIETFKETMCIEEYGDSLETVVLKVVDDLLQMDNVLFIFDNIQNNTKNMQLVLLLKKIFNKISANENAKVIYTSTAKFDKYTVVPIGNLKVTEAKLFLDIDDIKHEDQDIDKIIDFYGCSVSLLESVKAQIRFNKSYDMNKLFKSTDPDTLIKKNLEILDLYDAGTTYKEIVKICSLIAPVKKEFLQKVCLKRGITDEQFNEAISKFDFALKFDDTTFTMYQGHQKSIFNILTLNDKYEIFNTILDVIEEDDFSWKYCCGIGQIEKEYKGYISSLFNLEIFNKDKRFEEILLTMIIYFTRFEKRNEYLKEYVTYLKNNSRNLFIKTFLCCNLMEMYFLFSEEKQKELIANLHRYEDLFENKSIIDDPLKSLMLKTKLYYALADAAWRVDDYKHTLTYVEKVKECTSKGMNVISFDSYARGDYFFFSTHSVMASILSIRANRGIAGNFEQAITLYEVTEKEIETYKMHMEFIAGNKYVKNYSIVEALLSNAIGVVLFESAKSVESVKLALTKNNKAYEIYKELSFLSGIINQLMNAANIHKILALKILEEANKKDGTVLNEYRQHLIISEYILYIIEKFVKENKCSDYMHKTLFYTYKYYVKSSWLKETNFDDVISKLKSTMNEDDGAFVIAKDYINIVPPMLCVQNNSPQEVAKHCFLNDYESKSPLCFKKYVLDESEKDLNEAYKYMEIVSKTNVEKRNEHTNTIAMLLRYRGYLKRMNLVTFLNSTDETKTKWNLSLKECYEQAHTDLSDSLTLSIKTKRDRATCYAYMELLILLEVSIKNRIYKITGLDGREQYNEFEKLLQESKDYFVNTPRENFYNKKATETKEELYNIVKNE